jgi:integrase
MKAKLWKTIKRGDPKWIVAYRVNGRLVRKFFDDEEVAEARRDELAGAPDVTSAEWSLVPDEERYDILNAWKLSKKAGFGLHDFVLRHYRPHDVAPPPPAEPAVPIKKPGGKTVQELAESFIDLKSTGWAPRTRSERIPSLRKLIDKLGASPVDAVTPELMQRWLDQWPGKRTQKTKRDHASILFNYAIERGWCAKNPCKPLAKIVFNQEVPTTFDGATCEQIMRTATPDMIAYFALCMFGGIRCCEVRRATWDQIDLEKKLVHIPGSASKTHKWRDIELPENAVAWLRIAKWNGKRVSPSKSTIDRRQRILVEQLKIDWDENILRHTAASMMAAIGKTTAEITDLLGHDERMFYNHYRARISREDAQAFYAIMPYQIAKATG